MENWNYLLWGRRVLRKQLISEHAEKVCEPALQHCDKMPEPNLLLEGKVCFGPQFQSIQSLLGGVLLFSLWQGRIPCSPHGRREKRKTGKCWSPSRWPYQCHSSSGLTSLHNVPSPRVLPSLIVPGGEALHTCVIEGTFTIQVVPNEQGEQSLWWEQPRGAQLVTFVVIMDGR